MAVIGLGFRDWATGDKPTEAQIQGYWQDQVVMHFATTAARDTAITAPGEGMMAYVAANRSIYRHNGTAWVFIEGWGTGSPEGAVTATKGALWHRTDGGAGTTLYIKESDTSNTGWVAVSSGTSVTATQARRTAGNVTANSASWANFDTGIDLTLSGVVAGDVVMVAVSGLAEAEAFDIFFDVVSVVGGSPVNSWGNDAAPSGSTYGMQGAWVNASVKQGFGASAQRAVVSGDLSAGTLTLRVRYRQSGAGNKTVNASAGQPFHVHAVNFGQ